MTDRIPTLEDVRDAYIDRKDFEDQVAHVERRGDAAARAEFYAWLARHDAGVHDRAIDEALAAIDTERNEFAEAALLELRNRPTPASSTTLVIPFHPKTIREALCVAEGAALRNVTDQNLHGAPEVLAALIRECDRNRPHGPDGKHGQLHAATCGCDDTSEGYQKIEPEGDR